MNQITIFAPMIFFHLSMQKNINNFSWRVLDQITTILSQGWRQLHQGGQFTWDTMTDHPQIPPPEIPEKVPVIQETGIPEETEIPENTRATGVPEVMSEVRETEDPKITTQHKKI